MHAPTGPAAAQTPALSAARLLEAVRERRPRVHCITNSVAQAFTANALLALGAVPSMTAAREEVAAFAAGADALLVNLGTLDEDRRAAMRLAIEAARARPIPWVLDPVFVERSPGRAAFARALAGLGPALVRGNAAEIAALGEGAPAQDLARRFSTVVAVTAETDRVSDGARTAAVAGGHALMAKVTAMGCAGSAVAAAFLAVAADPFEAAAAALRVLGAAGEMAAEAARGPGTFAAAYLDALEAVDAGALGARPALPA